MNPQQGIAPLPAISLPWLLSLALVVSWLDFDPVGLPFRTGLVWSALVVACCGMVFWKQEGPALLSRISAVEAAAAFVAVSALLSAFSSGAAFLAIAEAVRIAVVLLFFCLVRLCPGAVATRTALGLGAVLVVSVNLCILLFGLLFRESAGALLFEAQFQEVLGLTPRFRGFAAHPMAFAAPFLPLVAMVTWPCIAPAHNHPRLALAAAAVAAIVLGLTLSFAAVTLVIVLACMLLRHSLSRTAGTLFAACASLLVLWCDPVSVKWSGQDWFANPPPPDYNIDGLGS
jgi:hypothetical protein